jgi:heat shock protein HslJ
VPYAGRMEELTAHRWGSDRPRQPWLEFAEDHRLSGTDGCNRLVGEWSRSEGGIVVFGPLVSTLMFCDGVDTWLRGATAARQLGDRLEILDAAGAVMGELPRGPRRSTASC